MPQPELLCGHVSFHRSAIQRCQHVVTERVEQLLQSCSELNVPFQRSPEGWK